VPTVLAASEPYSASQQSARPPQQQGGAQQQQRPNSKADIQPGPNQQSPAQQNPAPQPPVQQGPVQKDLPPNGSFTIFPLSFDFGDVTLPAPGSKPNSYTTEFTVSNGLSASVNLSIGGFVGDQNGEFKIDNTCDSVIKPDTSCKFKVALNPTVAGEKTVVVNLQASSSTTPIQVRLLAKAHTANEIKDPSKAGSTPPPANAGSTPPPVVGSTSEKPVAPLQPPDLLAIRFIGDRGELISTGGWAWTLTQGTWRGSAKGAGTTEDFDKTTWRFTGPAKAMWATETRLVSPNTLDLPTDPYGCRDCTIRSRTATAVDGNIWAAGWTTDADGEHASVIRSQDYGAHWIPVTRGALPADRRQAAKSTRIWIWPPVWYWLVLLVSLVIAAPALLPPPDVEWSDPKGLSTANVEGRLSSDKPLDPGDVDVLGLTSIALGLSRFLRNAKTLPPLTLAINGEWGSGKSSLMNLLRCDLESYGMRPVWFNAWHHQKEEHLLAALLQTIRLEAVPPLWNVLGLPFRARLLWYRVHRRWPLVVLLGSIAIFVMVVDWHLRRDLRTDLIFWLLGQVLPTTAKSVEPISILPIQGGLLTVLATGAALWKGLTAFGANPAALLASVAKGNKLRDLDAQTSFRQRFAVEFRDFTNALGAKRPLVIFIDDLDRCLPENVREVLEAVNFLVTSGDCFIVLGIDREQVQRAIGLSFREVAEEAGPVQSELQNRNITDAELKEASRLKRAEFAQKYLQKLINLEVRVPVALDDATKRRLFERDGKKTPEPARERLLRGSLRFTKRAIPVATAVLLLIGTFELSMKSIPVVKTWILMYPLQPASDTASKSEANKPSSPAMERTNLNVSPPPAVEPKTSTRMGMVVSPVAAPDPSILPTRSPWPARWILSLPLYVIAIFVLLAANVVLTTRSGVVTHDSKEFTDALECAWYAIILAKQNTPRAAKRFVNRVRYLAMRQRTYREDSTWWDRAIFTQRLHAPARAADWKPIPEPLLVAMAAIEQMEGRWVYENSAFSLIVNEEFTTLAEKFPAVISQAETLLETARNEHKKAFPDTVWKKTQADWPSLSLYHETFLIIWPRADVSETRKTSDSE
jgi:hypothetical protein